MLGGGDVIKKFGLVAGCAALLAFPVVAHADAQDDQFINLVRSHGVDADPGALIDFAHHFCDAATTYGVLGAVLNLGATQNLATEQVRSTQYDAANVYCPDKLNYLNRPRYNDDGPRHKSCSFSGNSPLDDVGC